MKLLSLIFLLLFTIGVSAQDGTSATVSMKFKEEHIQLGKIERGEKRTFDYIFTNTGKEDIKIDIISACECSTVDWTRKKIKPGEEGKINVIFDSTEKEEAETVTVDITLQNIDPDSGAQIFKLLYFTFEY